MMADVFLSVVFMIAPCNLSFLLDVYPNDLCALLHFPDRTIMRISCQLRKQQKFCQKYPFWAVFWQKMSFKRLCLREKKELREKNVAKFVSF
jgi:hypothetical protein